MPHPPLAVERVESQARSFDGVAVYSDAANKLAAVPAWPVTAGGWHPAVGPSIGAQIEAELVPGHWLPGSVADLDLHGRLTVQFQDGSTRRGIDVSKVRPARLPQLDHLVAAAQPRAVVATPFDTVGSSCESEEEEAKVCEIIDTKGSVATSSLPSLPRAPQRAVCRGFCFGTSLQLGACSAAPALGEEVMLEAGGVSDRRVQLANLEAVLADAQRGGLPDHEVARAREALLSLEAEGMRSHAAIVVEDAIESGDFWQLQAAMQTAVSCGLAGDQLVRLQEAMRAFSRDAMARQQE